MPRPRRTPRGTGRRTRPCARSRPRGGSFPPLVEAKLVAPRVRRGMVDRPRIEQALDAGDDATLTLVAAPAGYGKTTAVRAWCASRDAALAWVTLDAGDNDPVRLWTYVATAVDRVRPGLGRGALRRLSGPGGAIEDAVDELMNAVAAFGQRTGHRARRPACRDRSGVPVVDRPCPRAPAGDRSRGPPHAGRSGARSRTATRWRRARRVARGRARVHPRGGPRAARRAWSRRARGGGDRPARRADRGLARRARAWPGSGCGPWTIPRRAVRRVRGTTSASWAST